MPIRILLPLCTALLFTGCASTGTEAEPTAVAQYVPCDSSNDEVVTGSRLPIRRECTRTTSNTPAPAAK